MSWPLLHPCGLPLRPDAPLSPMQTGTYIQLVGWLRIHSPTVAAVIMMAWWGALPASLFQASALEYKNIVVRYQMCLMAYALGPLERGCGAWEGLVMFPLHAHCRRAGSCGGCIQHQCHSGQLQRLAPFVDSIKLGQWVCLCQASSRLVVAMLGQVFLRVLHD